MEKKFERVHYDGDDAVTPKLYRRVYATKSGKQKKRH